MPYEITSADIKVGVVAAFLVAAIGTLSVLTAGEAAPEPPRPIPKEILDKCTKTFLPGVCVEIEMAKKGSDR